MNWSLNGIRVFTSKYGGNAKQIMPTLQPLSGGTVVQFYGYETVTTQIAGLVVGSSDLNALINLTTTGSDSYTLASPEGSLGTFSVKSVKFERLNIYSQTIRPDLSCYSPVYNVEIDLQPS